MHEAGAYTVSRRYLQTGSRCKRKGMVFALTLAEFERLSGEPCYYCGGEYDTDIGGCHLDRIDNDRGYEIDNVISCCGHCNCTRRDRMSVREAKLAILAQLAVAELTRDDDE